MHITKLTTKNWKGRDLDLALTPVTVVTGDNFAGKTSVPMAIRFALTGYLPPPIGKRNEAIFALAGDQAQADERDGDYGHRPEVEHHPEQDGEGQGDAGRRGAG